MELKISDWKDFKISDYFEVLLSSGDLKIDDCELGEIPLVSSGASNNGVVGYIDKAGDGKAQIFKSNSITVDMFCNAFYQNKDFYAVSHGRVNILYPKFEFNKFIGLFICSIINKEKFKFSYGRAVYSSEISRMVLKLPSTISGSPDWNFMEKYIKSLNNKVGTTKNAKQNSKKVSVAEWKEFNILRSKNHPGLFIIENCKCGSAGDLDDGIDINYIGAKKSDNGVMRRVGVNPSLVSAGNGIMFICDGEGSVGYANYMDKSFIGSTTTSIGYDESLNKYNALFIVTILDKEKFKFSYGRKYRAHINDIRIKLPVKYNRDDTIHIDHTHKYSEEGYVPDWDFMENYMKSLPYGDRI